MNNNETIKNRVWTTGWVVGIMLVVFLAALSIKVFKSLPYVGRDVAVMNMISVNGKGEMITIPDIATFSFSITETAKTVDVAQAAATTRINAVLKALKDSGVAEKDLQTLSYNINPHYDYGTNDGSIRPYPAAPKLTGYDVVQTIQVKIRDLKKAGAILSIVGGLNVENVNGLSFAIDDIESVKAKARNIAIDDAKAKAKVLANQLGVHIVRISSYTDQTDQQNYGYGVMSDRMMMKTAVAPQANPDIPTGEQKVVSNVTITYEIR